MNIDGYTLTLTIKPYSDFKTCDLTRFVAFLSAERDDMLLCTTWNIGLNSDDSKAFAKSLTFELMKRDVLAEAHEKWIEICDAVEQEIEDEE